MPGAMTISSAPSSETSFPETEAFPSVAIIVVYFGALPQYFQLWLDSCRRNDRFEWLVFTDADATEYSVPGNVHFRALTLDGFSQKMSAALGFACSLGSPYKVCDFRPIFWALLDGEPRTYDFWGHCDLDMIFGDLKRFITAELLARYDKLFSVGHLTLYRNCQTTNEMFRQPHPDVDWRAILADPRHRGFDEHIGVSRIWRAHGGRFYKNERIIADIDPAIKHFECMTPMKNYRRQLFYYDDGRVRRVYRQGGRWRNEEFMYIHFQKRPMLAIPKAPARCYAIAPGGFYELPFDAAPASYVEELNKHAFRFREAMHRWRFAFRLLRRRHGLGPAAPRLV